MEEGTADADDADGNDALTRRRWEPCATDRLEL